MERINAHKIKRIICWSILIINIFIISLIIFTKTNPIVKIYNLFFVIIVLVNSIILLCMSAQQKNRIFLINCLSIVAIIIIANFINSSHSTDEEIWSYRNKIVKDIENNKYTVENGIVYLPDEDIYEKVSDTKRVILATDGDETVIYFYKNAGMLEDSCGYIFYSDKLDSNKCDSTIEFINKRHIKGKWYYCSTQ